MKKYPHTLKGLALAGLLASFRLAAAEYNLLQKGQDRAQDQRMIL